MYADKQTKLEPILTDDDSIPGSAHDTLQSTFGKSYIKCLF